MTSEPTHPYCNWMFKRVPGDSSVTSNRKAGGSNGRAAMVAWRDEGQRNLPEKKKKRIKRKRLESGSSSSSSSSVCSPPS